MTTFTSTTDSSGKTHPIPRVSGDAIHKYLRHTLGDVDASRIIREAKKLGRTIRTLAEAGNRDAVRELVERINSAPAL
jgi:hypothetical protein